ncbi:hypothetical protein GJ744_010841 [Endocarpon pusillum]|uniref:Uncharacterized protein n=1 Tax=Endocarpon pusillum TaxID=364733 RepID=A0A8H7E1J6_9EURO|nr:hypothetical protein GJ744_010841 [Endocarpon pusillum]
MPEAGTGQTARALQKASGIRCGGVGEGKLKHLTTDSEQPAATYFENFAGVYRCTDDLALDRGVDLEHAQSAMGIRKDPF